TPGTGSIEFNLSNEYTWNIEVQDENYNALAVLDDAQGTVLVNQLDAQEYHVVAISSCGLMADLPSVELSDDSAPQSDFDLSHTEVYVNQTVYITSIASNVQGLLYDFGDGTLDSLNANPTHQYNSPGIYEITQYAQSENCTESSTMMIEVFERESNDDISIDGFEADG
ncbi:MAG: PKD domain-containing protein, partial [Flavobacteriales bacterium]|nr:PKD domain-containing protein [Flavobacteriales bacterium]